MSGEAVSVDQIPPDVLFDMLTDEQKLFIHRKWIRPKNAKKALESYHKHPEEHRAKALERYYRNKDAETRAAEGRNKVGRPRIHDHLAK